MGEHAPATQDLVHQRTERLRWTRLNSPREPAGAPQVRNPLPPRERTVVALQRSQDAFLCADLFDAVVGPQREREARRECSPEITIQLIEIEQRQLLPDPRGS